MKLDHRTADARAARIVNAHHAARAALVELSNSIHDATQVPDQDHAIDVAYVIAYTGPADAEGIPTPLLDNNHGDALLTTAADIRSQINTLDTLALEAPSYAHFGDAA